MESLRKFRSKICVLTTIHVSWPNFAKIGRCEVAEKWSIIAYNKKPRHWETSEPPVLPLLSRSRPKFHERCRPVSCAWLHVYRLWSGSTAVCRTYLRFAGLIPERVLKSQYIIGWNLLYRLSAYKKFDDTHNHLYCKALQANSRAKKHLSTLCIK